MPKVCNDINEWIEESITRPVEEFIERADEVCDDWPWPLDWMCSVVVTIIKVIVYIVDIVVRLVVHTVCVIVAAVVTLATSIVSGVWNMLVGIFTLDWERFRDGFFTLVTGIVEFVVTYIRVVFFGDAINFLIDERKQALLKAHIRNLLEAKYEGALLDEIKDALGLEHGAFGFRLQVKAPRVYLYSGYRSNPAMPPDLWQWHNDGKINLRQLCGFEYDSYWNRSRHLALQTIPGSISAGGGSMGPESGTLSEEDLDNYINSRGDTQKQFFLLSMSESTLDTKLHAAEEAGRDIGLLLNWQKYEVQITELKHLILTPDNRSSPDNQVKFLHEKIGRHLKSTDPGLAIAELGEPVAAGAFGYSNKNINGLSTPLEPSICIACIDCGDFPGLDGELNSGCTFRDRWPDIAYQYVPIHELGHYFGLCHVSNGLDRIMFSPQHSGYISWRMLYEFFYFSGRPSFIYAEAKQAWNYIIANFHPDALRVRH